MVRAALDLITGFGKKTHFLMGGLILVILCFAIHPQVSRPSSEEPGTTLQPGDPLPRISFSQSLTPGEISYLGIGKKQDFSFDELRANLLVADFINTDCHFCIQSVPIINEIYQTLEKDPTLKSVKLVAIGVGDTLTEVEAFKKTYEVLFPVLLDMDYKAHDAIGEPRVPFLIIAKRDGRGKWIVVSTKVGLMGTSEKRTATYLEGDLIVETIEGDIFSVEQFIDELRTFLNNPVEKLRRKNP